MQSCILTLVSVLVGSIMLMQSIGLYPFAGVSTAPGTVGFHIAFAAVVFMGQIFMELPRMGN
jgi:Na+-translocating ferredoxin:NAD+ oxidoreductase RnfA subunit